MQNITDDVESIAKNKTTTTTHNLHHFLVVVVVAVNNKIEMRSVFKDQSTCHFKCKWFAYQFNRSP